MEKFKNSINNLNIENTFSTSYVFLFIFKSNN